MNKNNSGLNNFQVAPGLDMNTLMQQIRQELSVDLPSAQIASALEKAHMGCLPSVRSLFDTFTVINTVSNQSFRVDGGFDFIPYAISGVAQSTDIDFVINSLDYNGNTNIFPDGLSFQMVKQWTAKPLDFFWYLPAGCTVNAKFTNGGTTAANMFKLYIFGQRVPLGAVQQIMSQFSMNGNG